MTNVCVFNGNIVRPLEVRTSANHKDYLSFTIAINQGKDQPAIFVDLVAFEKTANFIADNFSKGDGLIVETSYMPSTFEKDGQKITRASFRVNRVNFATAKRSGTAPKSDTPSDPTEPTSNEDDSSSIPF